MATDTEVVEKYSSPSLKRCVLSRYGMAWRLRENFRMTPEERKKLLDDLYGRDA